MKNLLYKEIRLVLHPTTVMFLAFAAMMLIPNYPYYVTFFYMTLGIFFMCLNGRENHDVFYTVSLPIRKKDMVKCRFGFVILLEMLQMVLCVQFALIRRTYPMPGNQSGMDANIAFFGLSFVVLAIFNYAFFTRYYKNPDKVGKSFGISMVWMWIFILLAEACTFAIPYVKNHLDTKDPSHLTEKLIVLGIGMCIYIVATAVSYKKAQKSFEKLDL